MQSTDLYLCWNEDTLFVAVYGIDVVEKEFYKDNIIPEEDRMELVLKIDSYGSEIKMRLGSDREPGCKDENISIFNSSGIFLTVNNITVLKLPAKLFGKSNLKREIELNFLWC